MRTGGSMIIRNGQHDGDEGCSHRKMMTTSLYLGMGRLHRAALVLVPALTTLDESGSRACTNTDTAYSGPRMVMRVVELRLQD